MQISALMYHGDVICVDVKQNQGKQEEMQNGKTALHLRECGIKEYSFYADSGMDYGYLDHLFIFLFVDKNDVIKYIFGAHTVNIGDGYLRNLQCRIVAFDLPIKDFDVHYEKAERNPTDFHIVQYFEDNIFHNGDEKSGVHTFSLSMGNAQIEDYHCVILQTKGKLIEYFDAKQIIIDVEGYKREELYNLL